MTNGSNRSAEFSDINSFTTFGEVMFGDPQISDGAINFCVAKQKLNSTQGACLAINFRHLCSAHRMRAIATWFQTNRNNPIPNQPPILAC